MKHTRSILKFVVAPCLAILLFALTLLAKPEQVQPAAVETGGGIALQPPAFLKSARAQDSAQVDFGFLIEEAGATAYTKLDQEIDLPNMESDFKTIGRQTDQFISGIMIAPGYEKLPEFGENAEIQVFLHRNGWIVAYLTRYQTAAALFDWVSYDEKRLKNNTLLENVVGKLALDAGASDVNVAYYDFRNPQATNFMLVADHADAIKCSESFEINIPRELTIYESSWSYAQLVLAGAPKCVLNDDYSILTSGYFSVSKWTLVTGEFVKAKFQQGVNHKLNISGTGDRAYCISYKLRIFQHSQL